MVFVKIRETYDLSTKKDKMTMLGVHTPSMTWLVRQYQGFFLNCKKFRIDKCDIACACASTLPADPLQIGTSETDIAPQDMFNPILYRAVSNDSYDTLNSRLYSLGYFNSTTTGGSVDQAQEAFTGVDNFALYYSILARPDGFRTASPQSGFEMRGLTPLVWEQLYSEQAPYSTDLSVMSDPDNNVAINRPGAPGITESGSAYTRVPTSVRGSARPYPALPTYMAHGSVVTTGNTNIGANSNTLGASSAGSRYVNLPDVPTVFVAQIIIPPSKLNLLYYRMVVEWTIEFIGVRPLSDIAPPTSMEFEGKNGNALAYFSDYDGVSSQSAKTAELAEVDTSSVAVNNGNIEMVMQV
uniref:Capsid protein n=1 Tax=Papio cynocephalus associated smacovirus TaxID=2213168 RepID=A0A455R4Q2_9VIRU|nr:capsid protein [Papio cynocephalus associated smacovirus]